MRRLLMFTVVLGLLAATSLSGRLPAGADDLHAVTPHTSSPAELPADPSARGYIGFCNEAGRNIVSGDVNARPFVWKAVASVPPPKEYQGLGQDAVLDAYQPRPSTLPVAWSGAGMITTSFYTNKKFPAVQATYKDSSLAEFIADYPPKLNGLYVFRMLWGKRDFGLYSASYPVTTIQVQGSRWHVVSGGTVDCGASTRAVSLEQLTGVATKQEITARTPPQGQSTVRAGQPRPIVTSPTVVAAAAGSSTADSSAAAAGPQGSGATSATATSNSSTGWVLWCLGALVVVLGLALLLSNRRRDLPVPAHPIDDDLKD